MKNFKGFGFGFKSFFKDLTPTLKVTVVGVVDPEQNTDDVQHEALDPSGSGPQETFQISHHSAEEFVSRKDLDVLSNQLE